MITPTGLDITPVLRFDQLERMKSVGHGTTFSRNISGMKEIRTAVTGLSDEVASRMRKNKVKAFGVKVDIKDPGLKTISRQIQLDNPTNLTDKIAEAAMEIIGKSWQSRNPIRMLTVTGINLCDENPGGAAISFRCGERKNRCQRKG